jgi:transcriptional regulator with XRE-family HTH domain
VSDVPTIGENLRRIRKSRRLGQMELAERSGVAQPTISGIERDRREPHPSTLQKLGDVLGVSLADFFEEHGPSKVPPPPKPQLVCSTPEELETKLYGAPVAEIKGELKAVLTEPEARELSDTASRDRGALESWLKEYAAAPTAERFARRADHERVRDWLVRARFVHDWLFDCWSKLYDPRPVPFKGIEQFAVEQAEAGARFLTALENEAEQQRIERSGQAG